MVLLARALGLLALGDIFHRAQGGVPRAGLKHAHTDQRLDACVAIFAQESRLIFFWRAVARKALSIVIGDKLAVFWRNELGKGLADHLLNRKSNNLCQRAVDQRK